MSDIKPELIEKAAIATYEEMQRPNWRAPLWDEIDTPGQERFLNAAHTALEAVADDLRAEGAERALREAADDLERRINEPGLILVADKYGGYHAGERARGQREVDVLRARADELDGGAS